MTYKPFSIIVVPFPLTDSKKSKKRPAVVLSSEIYQNQTNHITLIMITSARHAQWYGDYLIKDLNSAGLPAKSIIRQKIFSIDMRFIIKTIGQLNSEDKKNLILHTKEHINLTS